MTTGRGPSWSSNDWTWIPVVGIVGVVAGAWHIALAIATPGHELGDLHETFAALAHGHPLEPTTATGETHIAALLAVLVCCAAVLIGVLVAWSRHRPRKVRDGLAAASVITRLHAAKDPHRQLIGTDRGKPVHIRSEDAGLLIAPPRSGKTTGRVVAGVIDAPGACVTTSTKVEVLRLTHRLRAAKGTIHVFDPEGLSQWPAKTTWNIVAGCEDPVEATERARAMVKAAPNGEGGNVEFFEKAASIILSCYLHAAALGGHTMERVVAWSKSPSNQEPYKILGDDSRAAPHWRAELEQLTRGDAGPTIQSTMMTLSNVLAALRTGPAIASVLPSKHQFDVDAFLESTGTLYLLSAGGEGSAGPLTTALVATVERRARIRSQRTSGGRFDVPVTLILDEAPNIAALPSLPSLMTDSGGRGVTVWAISQSYAQLRARWGDNGAATMLNGAAILLVLGGIKEVDLLDQLTRLSGERRVERHTQSSSRDGGGSRSVSTEWEQNLRFDDIRGLPQGRGLMWYLAFPPAELEIPAWWQRKDAAQIRTSETEALQREGFTV